MDNIESNVETWQVEAGGQIFDTNFDEMAVWIADGSLLRIDRVRKGNLRWIEAGKVPSLTEFFNAKDAAAPPPPVITTSSTEILGVSALHASTGGNSVGVNPTFGQGGDAHAGEEICGIHPEAAAAFVCDTCGSFFCKACPTSYGSNVKICPFCGAMCSTLAKAEQVRTETVLRSQASAEGFGFGDFFSALAYPFRFKFSLFAGALMFALVSLGSNAAAMGGFFLMSAALICFMLANMLTFGILGNVADNFSQGKLDENFMPSFDDFSLWDDVVHPFFLSVGVYLSSFGPLMGVFVLAIFFVAGGVKDELRPGTTPVGAPDLKTAQQQLNEEGGLRDLVKKQIDLQDKRAGAINDVTEADRAVIEAVDAGDVPEELQERQRNVRKTAAENEEKYFEDLNKMIGEQRKAQLESAIGKAPETQVQEQEAMLKQILGYGALFLLLAGLALLWGLFYFPAACTVAGYTRSFMATVNPLVGLDTIKRLGFDYAKLLAMGLVLFIMSGIVATVLNAAFSAFDLPRVGNVPAAFIGSFFTFYFSVVFSCTIGYLLYKSADRLKLFSR